MYCTWTLTRLTYPRNNETITYLVIPPIMTAPAHIPAQPSSHPPTHFCAREEISGYALTADEPTLMVVVVCRTFAGRTHDLHPLASVLNLWNDWF